MTTTLQRIRWRLSFLARTSLTHSTQESPAMFFVCVGLLVVFLVAGGIELIWGLG